MSGEERCAREGCSARLYGRDGYCSMSCEDLHRTERERDEALAEVERLTVICEEAGVQVGLLEREVERLREREQTREAFLDD